MAFNRDLNGLEKSMRSVVGVLDQTGRSALKAQIEVQGLKPAVAQAEQAFSDLAKRLSGTQGIVPALGSLKTAMSSMKSVFGGAKNDIQIAAHAVSDLKTEMDRQAVSAKVLEGIMKVTSFRLRDTGSAFHSALKGARSLSKGLDQLGAGFSNAFSSPETTMGGFRRALLSYNQLMFESMRTNTTLGRSEIFQEQFWSKVKNNTKLGREAFLDLNQKMIQLVAGVPLTRNRLLDLTNVLSSKMGPSVEKVAENFQRFAEMQTKMPRLQEHLDIINKLNAGGQGQGGLAKTLFFFKEMGADNRSINFLARYVEKLTEVEQSALKFESAMSGRNQSLQDFNSVIGKEMEGTMVGIEKVMTSLTESITKLTKGLEEMTGAMGAAQVMSQGNKFLTPAIATVGFGAQAMQMAAFRKTLGSSLAAGGASATGAAAGQAAGQAAPRLIGQSLLSAAPATGGLLAAAAIPAAIVIAAATITVATADIIASKRRAGKADDDYRELKSLQSLGFNISDEALKKANDQRRVADMEPEAKMAAWGNFQPWNKEKYLAKSMGSQNLNESFMAALSGANNLGTGDTVSLYGGSGVDSAQEAVQRIADALNKGQIGQKQAQKIMTDFMPNSGMSGSDWHLALKDADDKTNRWSMHDNRSMAFQQKAIEEKGQGVARDKIGEDSVLRKLKLLEEVELVYKRIFEISGKIAQEEEAIGAKLVSIGYSGDDVTEHYRRRSDALNMQAESAKTLRQETDKYLNLIKEKDEASIFEQAIEDYEDYEVKLRAINSASSTDKKVTLGSELITEIKKEAVGANDKDREKLEKLEGIVSYLSNGTTEMLEQQVLATRAAQMTAEQASRLKAVRGEQEAVTKQIEGQALMYSKLQSYAELQADYVEKMALGMAASYAMRQESYELTRAERLEHEKSAMVLKGQLIGSETMKEAGVGEDQLKKIGDADRVAFLQTRRILLTNGEKDAAADLTEQYEKILDVNTRIVQMKSKELDQTMAIREGFLDVINEMTTGSDLISRLLPNAERGRMQLLDISRMMSSADFGGAMRVGFASMTGFGDSTAAGFAPRYGERGIQGSFENVVQQAYFRNANALHPKVAGAQFPSPDRFSNTGEAGTHPMSPFGINAPAALPGSGGSIFRTGGSVVDISSGGVIPGTPAAGRDNMFGYLSSGRTVVVGSGEGFIPASKLRKPGALALAKSINSGGMPSVNAAVNNPMGVNLGAGGYVIRRESMSPGVMDMFAEGGNIDMSRYRRFRRALIRAERGVRAMSEENKPIMQGEVDRLRFAGGPEMAARYDAEKKAAYFKRIASRHAYYLGRGGDKENPAYQRNLARMKELVADATPQERAFLKKAWGEAKQNYSRGRARVKFQQEEARNIAILERRKAAEVARGPVARERLRDNPYREGTLDQYYKKHGINSAPTPYRAAVAAGNIANRSQRVAAEMEERKKRLASYNGRFLESGGLVIPEATIQNGFFEGGSLSSDSTRGLNAGGNTTMTGGITIENLMLGGEVLGKNLRSNNDNAFELIKIQNRG